MTPALSKIIGRTVALQGVTFKGLCPFHAERTPSFTVNDASGTFHCLGCRAQGDATEFERRLAEMVRP